MKRAWLALSLSALLLAGCGGGGGRNPDPDPDVPNTITVGAMLDQTGTLTDFTAEYTAACQLAIEDENARLTAAGSSTQFSLSLRDSKSTPTGAGEAMQAFVANDVDFVLGPRTSAQSTAALAIAQPNGAAILSTRSVADDLSLPNDALFRLISPDREVIPLVAQNALARGSKYLCVLYRNDVFGNSALEILTASMRAGGGDVVYSQAYDPSGTPSDAELQQFVDATLAQERIHDHELGVAYFSLSEMVEGFAKLDTQSEDFKMIPSTAAQSLANVPALIANGAAHDYCDSSAFEAVAFALAEQPASGYPAGTALLERIATRSGNANPDELAINVYDGMRALLRAAQRSEANPVEKVKAELGSSPTGTLGQMKFDANGDRIGDFFGVYQIDSAGISRWVRVATLTP
ncbi:MAG: ABC transporter substrate-binding protein [Fimbriimonas sp.]